MATVSKTFTVANTSSATLLLGANEAANIVITRTGSGSFAVKLYEQDGAAFKLHQSFTADTAGTKFNNPNDRPIYLLLTCTSMAGGDSIATTLADVAGESIGGLFPIVNDLGVTVLDVSDDGIETPLITATDAAISALAVTGNLTTGSGVGTKNGATVTVVELGDGAVHKSVFTLASTPLPIVSVTTGAGVGGIKIYDFPQGRICVLGTMANLSLVVGAAKQADFTDNTPEGDIGVGTVAPANADALGDDATDDDFATATAFAMTAFADTSVQCPSEALLQHDGTGTAKSIIVTGLVDAADIDNDVTTELEVSGTITVVWANLGDF
jgi:hypothetical protein